MKYYIHLQVEYVIYGIKGEIKMAWVRFTVFMDNYRSKQAKYTYALPQDAIRSIVVNPQNEIVFDVGSEDNMYATEKFADYAQATLIFNEILNSWGKDIFVPRPIDVDKYLEDKKENG